MSAFGLFTIMAFMTAVVALVHAALKAVVAVIICYVA